VEFNYLPNNLVRLENLKTISVSAALKTSDNTPLAVLYASQLRKKDGSIATGKQDAVLTVRKDAAFAVSMNGVTVVPGDSKDISIDFGKGDGALIPIFSATSGNVGESSFMIELPQIQ
ncbi:TPA: hypothetical protein JLP24_004534, partial [Escherichia coli]|nr:hypothetical protein [Escherichia coli]